jgi:misacylated tRNA(Ala) deacylase
VLDRTVFYPLGGGQAGDTGRLQRADGASLAIVDTRKPRSRGRSCTWWRRAPTCRAGPPAARSPPRIDADRARRTALPHRHAPAVRAGAAPGGRLQHHRRLRPAGLPHDRAARQGRAHAGIARLVAEAHPVRHRWISEAELDANPGLVRSMSVQPPRGSGPRARARDRRRRPAALRRHPRGQHRRDRRRGGHEDREEERDDAARGARLRRARS